MFIESKNTKRSDVTWFYVSLFPEFPASMQVPVIRQPDGNEILSTLFLFVCWKFFSFWNFSSHLVFVSLEHEKKYFKYFFFLFFSSTYLKLSESIIFPTSEQWEGKN